MTTLIAIILCAGVVCYVLFGAILETGSSTTVKQTSDEPTELDAEMEAHIDSFEKPPSTN